MKTPIPIVNFTVNPSYTSIKEHNDDKLIEQIVEKGEQESTLEILTGKGLQSIPPTVTVPTVGPPFPSLAEWNVTHCMASQKVLLRICYSMFTFEKMAF